MAASAKPPRPSDRHRKRRLGPHPQPRLAAVRAVVQRVLRARVVARGETVGAIGPGLCVLLGIADDDSDDDAERLAGKIARLRIFENDAGKFDLSLLDVKGEALIVSQFTLIADTKRQKGNRPDFSRAASRTQAEPLYERFREALRELGVRTETGIFGARMHLELANDGPVTIVLDV
jgi:D-aminoacyl-tRNA deacylase